MRFRACVHGRLHIHQVFVQATEGIIPTRTLSKISTIRHGALRNSTTAATFEEGGRGSGNRPAENGIGSKLDVAVRGHDKQNRPKG